MIKRLFSSIKAPISITNNAWDKMSSIVYKKNGHGFIFSAISGGCNGLNYDLKLINNKQELENLINNTNIKTTLLEKDNTQVYIDPLSEMFLLGTTIDYISEDYEKNIFENKFVFYPDKNIATSCGCGVSFAPIE